MRVECDAIILIWENTSTERRGEGEGGGGTEIEATYAGACY